MGQTARRILENSVWQIIQRIGGQLLAYVLVIFMARKLGAEQYGTYIYAVSFANIFMIFADYGLSLLFIRDLARSRYDTSAYISNVSLLKLLLSALTISVIFAAVRIAEVDTANQNIILIIALYLVIDRLGSFLGCVFQAFEKMSYNAIIELAQRTLVLAACTLLLLGGKGILAICFVLLFSSFLHCASKVFLVHLYFAPFSMTFKKAIWKEVLREGFPLALVAAISVIYYNADVIILEHIHGQKVVGWYGVSYQLFFAVSTVSGSFLSAIYPVMSRTYSHERDHLGVLFNKCFKLIAGIGVPMSVGSLILRSELIRTLYGDAYQVSSDILAILSGIIVFSLLSGLFGYLLTSMDRQKSLAWALLATTILNIVLNLMLIPSYSYYGAAWSTVASQLVLFVITLMMIPGEFRKIPVWAIFKILTTSALMGIIVYLAGQQFSNLILLIAIGAAIYAVLFFFCGVLDVDDRRILLSALPKISRANKTPADA